MKKLKMLFVALGLFTIFALSFPKASVGAKADDEVVEVVEENEEEIVSDEDSEKVEENNEEIVEEQPATNDTTLSLSQVANDTIAVIKEVFSQPLVIGGVSTTLGALILLIVSKAIQCFKSADFKKIKSQLAEIESKAKGYISKNDYDALKGENDKLKAILSTIIPTIKNCKVKENAVALLGEIKPIAETIAKDSADFVAKETEITKSEILEILDKE